MDILLHHWSPHTFTTRPKRLKQRNVRKYARMEKVKFFENSL